MPVSTLKFLYHCVMLSGSRRTTPSSSKRMRTHESLVILSPISNTQRYSLPTLNSSEIAPFSLTACLFSTTTNLSSTGNIALSPLRTRTRGPAYGLPPLPVGSDPLNIDPDSESYDALDEVLSLFRANTFFRNFEIKGPADRLLIYGILFVSECLGKIKGSMVAKEAEKVGSLLYY